jgi:hypothetical protein
MRTDGQSDVITAEANMKNEEQVSEVSNQRWTDVISWKYQKGIDVEGLDEMRGDRIGCRTGIFNVPRKMVKEPLS